MNEDWTDPYSGGSDLSLALAIIILLMLVLTIASL